MQQEVAWQLWWPYEETRRILYKQRLQVPAST